MADLSPWGLSLISKIGHITWDQSSVELWESSGQDQISFLGMTGNLNPGAPAFYSQTMPVIFMPPVEGVCYLFQFGQCKKTDHHKSEDGLMALHICQARLQFRQNLVDHTCSGGHPNHPVSCGQKRLGASACPFQLSGSSSTPSTSSSSSSSSISQTEVSSTSMTSPPVIVQSLKDIENIHRPRFSCNCNSCADYFYELQQEIDDHDFDFDLNTAWTEVHFPDVEDCDFEYSEYLCSE